MKRVLGLVAAAFLVILGAGSVSAATLNVVSGQLLGASGVDVGGTVYSVEFLDGTCIDLYSGCDAAVSDFTFQTQGAATLASNALLDQVFLDGANLFDSDPELTAGCTGLAFCQVRTPFGLSNGLVVVITTSNREPPLGDGRFVSSLPVGQDLTVEPLEVYAVWTPVPEPGTAVLTLLGLTGLGWAGRTKHA